jgi:hypothetical protein
VLFGTTPSLSNICPEIRKPVFFDPNSAVKLCVCENPVSKK